jgi:hypothetical protein
VTRTPRETAYAKLLAKYERKREKANEVFRKADDAAWAEYLKAADELARSQPCRLPGDANG